MAKHPFSCYPFISRREFADMRTEYLDTIRRGLEGSYGAVMSIPVPYEADPYEDYFLLGLNKIQLRNIRNKRTPNPRITP